MWPVKLKNAQCFGTRTQPSHFLPNMPVMTQRILTGPAHVEWLWVNDFSPNEYNTVQCRYNAVNFPSNIHKRHPIARPLGRGMGCLWWKQHLIDNVPQFLELFMCYLTILGRVITALDCIWHAWPSASLHVENKSPKYEAPIFTAQKCNHWRKWKGRVSVPKNGLPNWCDWILCQCQ